MYICSDLELHTLPNVRTRYLPTNCANLVELTYPVPASRIPTYLSMTLHCIPSSGIPMQATRQHMPNGGATTQGFPCFPPPRPSSSILEANVNVATLRYSRHGTVRCGPQSRPAIEPRENPNTTRKKGGLPSPFSRHEARAPQRNFEPTYSIARGGSTRCSTGTGHRPPPDHQPFDFILDKVMQHPRRPDSGVTREGRGAPPRTPFPPGCERIRTSLHITREKSAAVVEGPLLVDGAYGRAPCFSGVPFACVCVCVCV
jgi:hypothetical protein